MAKKSIKLSEKDLSNLIQSKVNEMYDDPIQKNKFEFDINQKLGDGIDAFIDGYHQITEALRLVMLAKDDKRTKSLLKIMDNLYYGIEALKDISVEVDPSMGIKGLKENATIDSILDKISRKEQLTNREKIALDMASKGENVDDEFLAKKGLEIKADGNIPFVYTHNKTEQHGENIRYYGVIHVADLDFNGYVEATPYGELNGYEFTDKVNDININDVLRNDVYELHKFGWKIIDELMFNEEN